MKSVVLNTFIFASQEREVSLGQWCQHCPHNPLGVVIVLHDDASELDNAICVFHFAAFYFSVFTVWCFSLVDICAILYVSDCGKILQA